MDVMTAIRTRRSHGAVTDEPISMEVVSQILEAAAWAPNHHRTEPWRFAVFMGDGRRHLAEAIHTGAYAAAEDIPESERQEDASKAANKVYRAPVIVAVWTAVGRGLHKNPPAWEDHAAVAAALQNMALATHALGLGGFWKTGKPCTYPSVQKLLGLAPDKGDQVMGFFYIGHKDPEKGEPLRADPHWAENTKWFDK